MKNLLTKGFILTTSLSILVGIQSPVLSVTMKGTIPGLMGTSNYPAYQPHPKKVTLNVDFTFDKIKTETGYKIDPKGKNTITFDLIEPYHYKTSEITITNVIFGENWQVKRIDFSGTDKNDRNVPYKDRQDLITNDSTRTIDLGTPTLSGFIDFMMMTGGTTYTYPVIGVKNSPAGTPIEPIPDEYKNGLLSDTTTFMADTIPKPDKLNVKKVPPPPPHEVPEPQNNRGSATALGFGAFFKRKLKSSKSSEKEIAKVG